MLRIFVWAILLWAAYFLVKKIAKSFMAPSDPREARHAPPPGEAELIRDPQCGAYFMRQKGVKGVVDGKVLHFCSEDCYEKYLKQRTRS